MNKIEYDWRCKRVVRLIGRLLVVARNVASVKRDVDCIYLFNLHTNFSSRGAPYSATRLGNEMTHRFHVLGFPG